MKLQTLDLLLITKQNGRHIFHVVGVNYFLL